MTQSFASRQWLAVPCRVLSSEVKSHSGSNGATYSVEITYAYQVDGKAYRGDRYRFLRMSSSGRAEKANVVARYARGTKALCYVNPRNPSEAVLDREIAPDAWFGLIPLVFVGVGAVGIAGALRGKGKWGIGGFPNSGNSATDGNEPWLRRPDWAAGRIVSSTKKMMTGVWVFAGIWNLVSMPAAWMVLSQHAIKKGNYGPALVFIFPLVGLGLLRWAVAQTRLWLRFGESVFEMACVPGAVGGALEGTIRLSRPMRPEGPVKLRLNCLARSTSSNSGDGNSTTERVLWQHEEAVELSMADAIPVAFYIPEDCSETTTIDSSDGTLWRLEATARTSDVNYAAQFEVPVFKVELSPEECAEAQRLLAREQAEVAAYVQPSASRIRVQMSLRGGTEFYFPACRNLGPAIGSLVIASVLSGIIWLMIHHGVPFLFPLVFGFFDVLVAFGVAQAWTGTTWVLVNPAGVSVTNSVLGISRRKAIPTEEIESIKTEIGMAAGTTVYHDIKIHCRNGKQLGAGSGIKDALEAEWLAAEMTKALAEK